MWVLVVTDKVEAANAKKAAKEQGEVTTDHTFKPKIRRELRRRAVPPCIYDGPPKWTVIFTFQTEVD